MEINKEKEQYELDELLKTCPSCGGVNLQEDIFEGSLYIYCPECGKIVSYEDEEKTNGNED